MKKLIIYLSIFILLLALGACGGDNATGPDPDPGPSGKLVNQIVFTSNRDGQNDLYAMNPDGSDQVLLLSTGEDLFSSAISPDGTRIAYVQKNNIWVVNADGTDPVQLTTMGRDLGPAWSPDGSQIVFGSSRDGDNEIYIMNADGTDQTNVSNNPAAVDIEPSWSPDGQRIAFTSNRDNNGGSTGFEVYTMNIDGTGRQAVTSTDGNSNSASVPQYSPDGRQIVFRSIRGDSGNIYTIDTDGSNEQQLTNNESINLRPTWSPDGSQIAYESNRNRNGENDTSEIIVINADGTNAVNISNNAASDGFPDWSPSLVQ